MNTLILTLPLLENGDIGWSSSLLLLSLTWVDFSVNDSKPLPPQPRMTNLCCPHQDHIHCPLPYLLSVGSSSFSPCVSACVSAAVILLECSEATGCGLKISGVMWRGGKVPSVSLRSAFSGTLCNHACYCTVCVYICTHVGCLLHINCILFFPWVDFPPTPLSPVHISAYT